MTDRADLIHDSTKNVTHLSGAEPKSTKCGKTISRTVTRFGPGSIEAVTCDECLAILQRSQGAGEEAGSPEE